MFKCKQ